MTFPQNSEVRTTRINALKSSYQAASRILVTSMTQWNKIMHDWSDGHNVWRQTKRGNIQLCILIYVKMEMTFYFSSYFVVLNEKDILFWILQYYCMWPDRPQYMDLWVIEKNLCGPLRLIFEYPCSRLTDGSGNISEIEGKEEHWCWMCNTLFWLCPYMGICHKESRSASGDNVAFVAARCSIATTKKPLGLF